jgi:hypothetical protein
LRELHSEIEIRATPQRIWQVLTRFDDYPAWNPFIVQASGSPVEGGRLRITVKPPGRRAMTFSPTVLVARPERELRWIGRVGLPGLFDGEHSFTLASIDGGRTRVVQHERFTGMLVPILGRGLYVASQEGFEMLTRALKERAEAPPWRTGRSGTKPSGIE